MKRIVAAEQFYTSAEVVAECLELVTSRFDFSSFQLVLEPAAGNGAFFSKLPPGLRVGLDIHPAHPEVQAQDFFSWEPPPGTGRVLTIGNPPYGQRGSLAVKFLEHAAAFSEVIAFVLPRSFRKYTFQNRVPQYFHLVADLDCEMFETPLGEKARVKSVFQIWEKRDYPRPLIQPHRQHNDFEMKHAHLSRVSAQDYQKLCADFDFAIPQVGANFTPREPNTVTRGSYWFIKAKAPQVKETFSNLDFSFLDSMNTAHKSLAKADIVTAYETARRECSAAR